MSINSIAPSGIIAGDKDIPAHLKKLPVEKCPTGSCEIKDKGPLDIGTFKKLPNGIGDAFKQLFNRCDTLIDETLANAHNKMFGAQAQALRGFYQDIKGMDQQQLDEMKDTLVHRMGSEDSSQWDRNLLEKMYQITDAVSEHRPAPHVRDPFDILPYKPGFDKPGFIELIKNANEVGVKAGVSVKF